jgi:hypothetical protein
LNLRRASRTEYYRIRASIAIRGGLPGDNDHKFCISVFGGVEARHIGLSALLVPPGGSGVWRVLGGLLVALSIFITLVTSGVLEILYG